MHSQLHTASAIVHACALGDSQAPMCCGRAPCYEGKKGVGVGSRDEWSAGGERREGGERESGEREGRVRAGRTGRAGDGGSGGARSPTE